MEISWSKYIEAVLPEEKDREALRRFASAVIGRRRPRKILCAIGSGRCGVSTISSALIEACSPFGPCRVRISQQAVALDPAGVLGRVADKPIMVVMLDPTISRSIADRLKVFHGGDTMVSRQLGSLVRASFSGGIFLESNQLPEWVSSNPGMAARIDIIRPVHVQSFSKSKGLIDERRFAHQIRAWAA
ncbi:hypothetical protein [Pseudodesulfovibrio pelocollis]|uniref:hypothetical protein n=1 Tax=Pseudodesulfovibrio pelocollis TaxID=3051432 RepID=UPI00255A9083|nr:hypothetical protein [Pseudodesulfovibrio sp. SB368]